MNKYSYDIPTKQSHWALADIMDSDLEKLEFGKNFNSAADVYNSILDKDPVYHSLMNFPEDEEDALYADTDTDAEEDNSESPGQEEEETDRESYKNTDQENMYYFI